MDLPTLFPFVLLLGWLSLFLRGLRGVIATPRVLPIVGKISETACAFIPARDEDEVIEETVRGLLAQSTSLDKIVIVDDASSDRTPEILARLAEASGRLEIMHGQGPGEGECGKPAALRLAVGAAGADCEWYLFVDADLVLEAGAVEGLIDFAQTQKADLVSVLPRLVLVTAIEQIVMPVVGALIAARFRSDRVNNPSHPLAFANGQLILIRRSVYEAVGGHDRVSKEILEDVRLAEAVKGAGFAIAIADGRQIARTRMYAHWAELVEGWSKNLYLLMGSSGARTVGFAAFAILVGGAGIFALIFGAWPVGLVAYVSILLMQMTLRALGGLPPAWALFAPVGAVLTAYLLLRSLCLHTRSRPIPWKGRRYG